MSLLVRELKKICREEGRDFDQFMKKLKEKGRPEPAQIGDMFGGREQ